MSPSAQPVVDAHAPSLFDPIRIGALDLANRVVMAPLTRSRAVEGLVPSPLAVDYYGQRASAGLIITEATQINPLAQGYISTPGLFTAAQIEGWRKVTDEVHRRGGRIVVQLWHVGRISHTSLLPPGEVPVAPSAVRANTKTFTPEGFVDVSEPRALAIEEIPGIVADFAAAARNVIDAGFDGVEIHAANGYLIDQFMRDRTNLRDDAYGGSIENRTRFLHEVTAAVVKAIGADRVGVRLAPVTGSNDIADSNPQPLFERAVERLDALNVAYVHVVEGATGGPRDVQTFDYESLRSRFRGAWIVNNGYDLDMAQAAVRQGRADAVAFGRLFISNPDLVRRFREGAALAEPDPDTFYSGGAKGYVDYPSLPG
ncbi:alkene reductase [Lysobacter claricitrinus]|uniref:alkene reductase n=1 Tax=Lysobacter claricitrinus TaxID=3367728 RepID=UPI0037DAA71C